MPNPPTRMRAAGRLAQFADWHLEQTHPSSWSVVFKEARGMLSNERRRRAWGASEGGLAAIEPWEMEAGCSKRRQVQGAGVS